MSVQNILSDLYFYQMRNLKQLVLTVSLLVILTNSAKATWSIIIIDPKTKEIGIAGASCTYSVYGIGGIVPGKGAVVVQAMSNKSARNKGLQNGIGRCIARRNT